VKLITRLYLVSKQGILALLRDVMLNDLSNLQFFVIANFVIVDRNKRFVHTSHLTVRIFRTCPTDMYDKLKNRFYFSHRRQHLSDTVRINFLECVR
jgi:hypothetical protein